MSAGQLDQRVTLLRRELGTSAAGSGAQLEEFVAAGTVWARIDQLRGGEAVAASARYASQTLRVRIRHRRDVSATWRLRWRDVTYAIEEVLPAGHGLREWLDLTVTATPAENAAP